MFPSLTYVAVICLFVLEAYECSLHYGTSHIFNGLEKFRKRAEDESSMPVCFDVQQLVAFKKQFSTFIDKDNDGRATFREIKNYLQKYDPAVSDEKVKEFLIRRDTNGDGTVDFIPDYLAEISAPNYSVTMAKEWFELEDTNNDGYVSRDELVKIALNIGMSPREAVQTADGYYMIADADGDQRLNWKDIMVRLTNGTTIAEGRLRIKHDGYWGTVCDTNFTVNEGHHFRYLKLRNVPGTIRCKTK